MSSNKSNKNNFIVQGSILAVASILVRLIGILYRIPMVRYIGEEGSGYYSYAFNIYNMALILSSYSLPLAVSKLVAARNIKKQYRNAYKVFTATMLLAIISGLVFACVLFFGAETIATIFYNDVKVAYPLKVLAPTLFVFAVMGVLRGFFQGKGTMLPTAISQVVEQIVNAIVSVVAAYYFMKAHDASENVMAYGAAGGTLGTLTGAMASFAFLALVFLLYLPTFRRLMKRDRTQYHESYPVIYKLLYVTIVPVILSQAVYQASGMLDDIIFASVMKGKGIDEAMRSTMVGIYSNKYRLLSNVPIAISSALASSLIPSIVASREINALDQVKAKIQGAIKFNMVIAIPCAVGMTVLAGPIMQLIFPGSSRLAVQLLVFGSVAIVFYALSTTSNAILQSVNFMKAPVTHAAISLGIHVVLLFALLQFTDLGVYALMIGNITFPLVVCILNWIKIRKELDYEQELVKTFLIPSISAVIMGIIALGSYKVVHLIVGNSISTIVGIGIGAVSYFVAMILLKGLTEEELRGIPKGNKVISLAKKLHMM